MARALKLTDYDPSVNFISVTGKHLYISSADLQVWYEFSNGALAKDSSGNERHATNNGVTANTSVPYSTDRFHTSGQFGTNKSIAFGSTPLAGIYVDTTMTFSFWVYFDSITGTQRILQIGNVGTGFRFENIDGDLVVTDAAWSSTAGSNTYDSFFSAGAWTHVLLTFDRAEAGYSPIVYKNGTVVTVDTPIASAGTRSNFAGSAYLGQSGADTQFLLGALDSFTVWSDILPPADVLAVANSTAGVHEARSGITSYPAKIEQIEIDVRTGSYPTIARTGDPDFTGRFVSPYDDTRSVNFVGGQTAFPTGLPSDSRFISGNMVTPNLLLGLVAGTAASSSIGIADAHLTFPMASAENISPFDESRISIDNDSEFYATGTASGTLPGFGQRLSSKAILAFDISPSTPTGISFSTGTQPNASGLPGGVNSGMAYFNWQLKRWEVLGDLTTGSNVDLINFDETIRRRGMMAFAPSGLNQLITTDDALASYVGLPVNNFGFPFHTKYDATGSQIYSLSGTINAPFLVEKIVLEFSASFGPEYIYNNKWGPCVKQFFILQQFELTDSGSLETLEMSNYFANDSTPASEGSPVTQSLGKIKELVAMGEISLIPSASSLMTAPKSTNDTWERDLNIVLTSGAGTSDLPRYNPITGSFRVEFTPNVYPRQAVLGAIPLALSGGRGTFLGAIAGKLGRSFDSYKEVVGTFWDGRQFTNASSGHSFIKSLGGTTPSGTVESSVVGNLYPVGSAVAVPVPKVALPSLRSVSPYILLPRSKIILGFANTPNFIANGFQSVDDGRLTERNVADAQTVLSPGAGRLVLFGSFLRNNLPVDSETNQPLTSLAIHEDLHFDNPVYDQFDVCPLKAMSGSYTDLIITGTMLADAEAANVRRVQGSVANATAGTTGSLQRFVRLTDTGGRLYDSFPPDVGAVLDAVGSGSYRVGSPQGNAIAPSTPDASVQTSAGQDSSWWLRSAYEVSSVRAIQKERLTAQQVNVYNATRLLSRTDLGVPKSILIQADTGLVGSDMYVSDDVGEIENAESLRRSIQALWGFGNEKYNAPSFSLILGTNVKPEIRGYKYGLAGLFGSSLDMRVRRDRYGQFRDVLEQRRHAAVVVNTNAVDYSMEVIFKSREGKLTSPEKTHSQNLSTHATSSKPYYDGLVVDRDDDPDAILAPVEIELTLT